MRPNLFVIGAMKSSTTTLHEHLKGHPDIFMCEPKEPSFFAPDRFSTVQAYGLGRFADYVDLFAAGENARWRGEASTNYTKWPHFPGVAARLHQCAPDARLIYLVRDPVDRAISHYWHRVRAGLETGTINQAFADRSLNNPVLAASAYGQQLKQWRAFFPQEQILVVRTDALHRFPVETMRGIYAWLGVDPSTAEVATDVHQNSTPSRIGIARTGRGLFARYLQAPRVQKLLATEPRAAAFAESMIYERVIEPRNVDTNELRTTLRALLAPDIELFEDLTGLSFGEWQ
jgi:hypothetical protein